MPIPTLIFVSMTLAQPAPDYARDIQPIFTKYCIACHGPSKQRGGLRVDLFQHLKQGANSGPVLGKKSGDSLLMYALLGEMDVTKMPPEGKPGPTKEEIARIRAWIDAGAAGPAKESATTQKETSDHWAFQKPVRRDPPAVKNQEWVRTPIDAYILQNLEKAKLTPAPEADRMTLLRRVALDLTGLPPTLAELEAFQKDQQPGAYERMVDRYLASPHYGERWARHWLDLARYADSNGFNIDAPRVIWPWRDWVIDALNRDMPFDEFTIHQLAGDLIPKANLASRIATGFHRNTLLNQEGGIDLEQFRNESIVDRVNTTGAVFLGLTLGCAQCHDHKFDPISQKEYYELFAFFNNCDEPILPLPTAAETKKLAQLKAEEARLLARIQGLDRVTEQRFLDWDKNLTSAQKLTYPTAIKDLLDKPDYQRSKKERVQARTVYRTFDQTPALVSLITNPGQLAPLYVGLYRATIEKQIVELKEREPKITTTLVLEERAKPRESYIHIRGDFTRKGRTVFPSTPDVMHPLPVKATPNRLDLAKWLVHTDNPLTARVIVNRVWQQYFGLGIVETENDFGTQGEKPSHPELLDWLATEFMREGWSLKKLHRLILTSAVYRQSSKERKELAAVDPRNRLLARQQRLRLEGEVVRDVALAASGLLSSKIGGPTVFPPQPEGVFAFTQIPREWKASEGADRYRRGLYTHFWRSAPHPGLLAFDAPDSTSTCTRRNRSNTPLQALTLLNDRAFFEFAQGLAERIVKSPDHRVELAFRLCLSRSPSEKERGRITSLVENLQRDLSEDEIQSLGKSRESAAWTLTARVLMNLDEFITRE